MLLIALGSTGCQAPSAVPTSEPTASVPESAAADCPNIDLRTPAGARIDLNGKWTTGSTEAGNLIVYEIRQSGECLWGRVYSAYVDQDPGESFDMILVGTARSDFTAEVELLELDVEAPLFSHFDRASATLAIRFESAAGDEALSLEIVALRARGLALGAPGRGLFPTGGPIVGAVLTRSP